MQMPDYLPLISNATDAATLAANNGKLLNALQQPTTGNRVLIAPFRYAFSADLTLAGHNPPAIEGSGYAGDGGQSGGSELCYLGHGDAITIADGGTCSAKISRLKITSGTDAEMVARFQAGLVATPNKPAINGHGIRISNSRGGRIEDVEIRGFAGNGLILDANSIGWNLSGVRAFFNHVGMGGAAANASRYEGCQADENDIGFRNVLQGDGLTAQSNRQWGIVCDDPGGQWYSFSRVWFEANGTAGGQANNSHSGDLLSTNVANVNLMDVQNFSGPCTSADWRHPIFAGWHSAIVLTGTMRLYPSPGWTNAAWLECGAKLFERAIGYGTAASADERQTFAGSVGGDGTGKYFGA